MSEVAQTRFMYPLPPLSDTVFGDHTFDKIVLPVIKVCPYRNTCDHKQDVLVCTGRWPKLDIKDW